MFNVLMLFGVVNVLFIDIHKFSQGVQLSWLGKMHELLQTSRLSVFDFYG